MKIFTGDTRIIEKEIKELLKLIEKTKTKSLMPYQTAETMIYFYELLTETKKDYFDRLINENYDKVQKKKRILERYKMKNIIATREEHEKIIAFLSTYCEEADFFYQYEDSLDNGVIDETEMYEIIRDFFQCHNKNALFAFDFLIKEKRIFQMPNKEKLARAYNLLNLYKNNFYIFIREGSNMVTTMTDIVHEIGHTMDEMHMLSSRKRKECNYYTEKSLLIESIALLYEKRFMDFLLEEGIYPKETKQEMVGYFSTFYNHLEEMELLFYLPDDLLEEEKYKTITKQEFIDYLEEDCSIMVNHESIFCPKDVDLPADLPYYYGFVFSSYFSYLRKHDYPKYQESFRQFLKVRADYFPFHFLEKIGTDCQELANIVCAEQEEAISKIKRK